MDDHVMDIIIDIAERVTLFRMVRKDEQWYLDVVYNGTRTSVMAGTLAQALDGLFIAVPELAAIEAE